MRSLLFYTKFLKSNVYFTAIAYLNLDNHISSAQRLLWLLAAILDSAVRCNAFTQ